MSKFDCYKYNPCNMQLGCCFCGCKYCRCAQGRIGPPGPQGEAGPTGPQGLRGEAGLQGIQGVQGAPGPQGLQGPTGATGADGTSVTILGSYDSLADLVREHPTGNLGDSYLIGGRLYVWDAVTKTWRDVGRMQGPDGLPGPQGVPGRQGDIGPTGSVGPQGIQGIQGTAGSPGGIGPTGPQGMQGTQGPTGDTGPQGPIAATIPFSVSKYGISLNTDSQGQPLNVGFSGFASSSYTTEYLREGEWASGQITIRDDMEYGTSFIVPHSGKLKKIYVIFSVESAITYSENVIIRPFVCLATSNAQELVYDILRETIVYTDPYLGGVEHPRHSIRRGAAVDLDVDLTEGTLVAIVVGIVAENVTEEQYGTFAASGGLYLQ